MMEIMEDEYSISARVAASRAVSEVALRRAQQSSDAAAVRLRQLTYAGAGEEKSFSLITPPSHFASLMEAALAVHRAQVARAQGGEAASRELCADLERMMAEERKAFGEQRLALAVSNRVASELPSLAGRLEAAEQRERTYKAALADAERAGAAAGAVARGAVEAEAVAHGRCEEQRQMLEAAVKAVMSEGGSEEALMAVAAVRRALSSAAQATQRKLRSAVAAAASAASSTLSAEIRAIEAEDLVGSLTDRLAVSEDARKALDDKWTREAKARQDAELRAERAERDLKAARGNEERLGAELRRSKEALDRVGAAVDQRLAAAANLCDAVEAAENKRATGAAERAAIAGHEEAFRSQAEAAEQRSAHLSAKVAALQDELANARRRRRRLLVAYSPFDGTAMIHPSSASPSGSSSMMVLPDSRARNDQKKDSAVVAATAYITAHKSATADNDEAATLLATAIAAGNDNDDGSGRKKKTKEKEQTSDQLRLQLSQLELQLRGRGGVAMADEEDYSKKNDDQDKSAADKQKASGASSSFSPTSSQLMVYEYDFPGAADVEHYDSAQQAAQRAANTAANAALRSELKETAEEQKKIAKQLADALKALKKSKQKCKAGEVEAKALKDQIVRIAKGRVSELSAQMVQMAQRDEQLHELISDLTDKVKEQEETLRARNDAVASLEARVKELSHTVAAGQQAEARAARLESQQLKEKLAVAVADATAARGARNVAIAEAREARKQQWNQEQQVL